MSFFFKDAIVPVTLVQYFGTVILIVMGSGKYCLNTYQETKNVIILVRLATSLLQFTSLPAKTFPPESVSNTHQDSALTAGMGT